MPVLSLRAKSDTAGAASIPKGVGIEKDGRSMAVAIFIEVDASAVSSEALQAFGVCVQPCQAAKGPVFVYEEARNTTIRPERRRIT